jgi:TatA/E family protein of Tat protein translocase
MVLLSPPKLLMILVIALIVLGPDKLPSVARRIGAAWRDFGRWRAQLESEVRATFPDLPSTTEVARAVRSPISVLDRLAAEHDATPVADQASPTPMVPTDAAPPASSSSSGDPPSVIPARPRQPHARRAPWADASLRPDVSSMN